MAKRFAIAFSFPGETRRRVERIAAAVAERLTKERILYDRYHEAEFARPNLDTHLEDLYHNEADLIVVVLCSDYQRKEWPGLEWRAIRDLIKQKQEGSIMFVRTDDATISGTYSIDGYIDARTHTDQEIAGLILQRLTIEGPGRPIEWCEYIINLIPEFRRTLYSSAVAGLLTLTGIALVQLLLSARTAPTPAIENLYANLRLMFNLLFISAVFGTILLAFVTLQKIVHARAVERQYVPWKGSCRNHEGRDDLEVVCEKIAMTLLTRSF